MKTVLAANAGFRALGLAFALGTIAAINTCIPIPVPAAESQKESSGFTEQLKKWQEKMSDSFRDTFKGLRGDLSGQQLKGSVSADLREQNDSYTLRLSLPDRDLSKVEISLAGNTLRVVAPGEGRSRRYEQSMVLADVLPGATPQIDRKQTDNLILVTVPKASSSKGAASTTAPRDRAADALTEQEHHTMEKMWQMQRDMDKIFENSFRPFSFTPDFKGFFDEARFGSSYTVEESNGNYVVRAYLPERQMNNVNVTIDGQTMTLEAKAEDAENSSAGDKKGLRRMAHYTQMITLPGPVNAAKMKVENKEGMVIVTLPKAGK